MKRILLALVVAFLLVGCFNGENGGTEPPEANETPPEQPPLPPNFIILNPEDNQAFETDNSVADIEVSVSTSNLIIRPPTNMNKIGEGHFVFQLDEGEEIRVFSKHYTLRNVEPGEHVLNVELVHNDGTAYSPSLAQTVRFAVAQLYAEPTRHEVQVNDFSYDPAEITINAGDIVAWTSVSDFPRTVTGDNFGSETLTTGESFTHAFDQPGTYEYTSVTYPGMTGIVTVEE